MATSWFNKMKRNLVVAAKGTEYDVRIFFLLDFELTRLRNALTAGFGIRRSQ